MKKKIFVIGAVLIVLISGGVYCMTKWIEHQNSPYNVSDVLDDKGVKLYKRGFRLLEEQLATYIKEHYSGVSKIEFSPIYVTGDDGSSMLNAEVVPIVYDSHGNKAKFGGLYKNFQHPAYGVSKPLARPLAHSCLTTQQPQCIWMRRLNVVISGSLSLRK